MVPSEQLMWMWVLLSVSSRPMLLVLFLPSSTILTLYILTGLIVSPLAAFSSVHAVGYGLRPRTLLKMLRAVSFQSMAQVSLNIFGAGLSSRISS